MTPVQHIEKVLLALAHRHRLLLLLAIAEGPTTRPELIERFDFGSVIHRYLRKLEAAELIRRTGGGRNAEVWSIAADTARVSEEYIDINASGFEIRIARQFKDSSEAAVLAASSV